MYLWGEKYLKKNSKGCFSDGFIILIRLSKQGAMFVEYISIKCSRLKNGSGGGDQILICSY